MKKHKFIAFMIAATFWSCSSEKPTADNNEAWNFNNDPRFFRVNTNVAYDSLPRFGQLSDENRPWSGDGWPTFRGGISHRWQSPWPERKNSTYADHLYEILPQDTLNSLSSEQLSLLSPAEKYDLFMGELDLPLTRKIRSKITHKLEGDNMSEWHGICHGWAAAAIEEKKPGPATEVKLEDGRTLRFYTADIQSLLSYYYAGAVKQVSANAIGKRCRKTTPKLDADGRTINDYCRDTNPASFHLTVTDYIGKRDKAFIMEADRYFEVWNHPVYGYSFFYTNFREFNPDADPKTKHRARDTKYLVDVVMALDYVTGTYPSIKEWDRFSTSTMHLEYSLELDGQKKIIGGEWTSETRPDFLWKYKYPVGGELLSDINYKKISALRDLSLANSVELQEITETPPIPDAGPDAVINKFELTEKDDQLHLEIEAGINKRIHPYAFSLFAANYDVATKNFKSTELVNHGDLASTALKFQYSWKKGEYPEWIEFNIRDKDNNSVTHSELETPQALESED